jgi:hypothetical protein
MVADACRGSGWLSAGSWEVAPAHQLLALRPAYTPQTLQPTFQDFPAVAAQLYSSMLQCGVQLPRHA